MGAPQTAVERGIKFGDICKIFNERGVVLGAAYPTERMIPGAAYVDYGTRFDPIDVEGVDRGGAINLITPKSITSKHTTGMAFSGFLVDVQKVTNEEMEDWKKRFPKAFARKINYSTGACPEGWLLDDKEAK